MSSKSAISKAYQTLVKRINTASRYSSRIGTGFYTIAAGGHSTVASFWNQAQPAFTKAADGKIFLALMYASRACFSSSINDGVSGNSNSSVLCMVDEKDAKKNGLGKLEINHTATMRQFKSLFGLSNDEFKRIWLTTAVKSNRDLYKLGHAGQPFLKAGESIESLAIEYDMA